MNKILLKFEVRLFVFKLYHKVGGGGGRDVNHNNRFVVIAKRLQRGKEKRRLVCHTVFMSHALCSSEDIAGSAQ